MLATPSLAGIHRPSSPHPSVHCPLVHAGRSASRLRELGSSGSHGSHAAPSPPDVPATAASVKGTSVGAVSSLRLPRFLADPPRCTEGSHSTTARVPSEFDSNSIRLIPAEPSNAPMTVRSAAFGSSGGGGGGSMGWPWATGVATAAVVNVALKKCDSVGWLGSSLRLRLVGCASRPRRATIVFGNVICWRVSCYDGCCVATMLSAAARASATKSVPRAGIAPAASPAVRKFKRNSDCTKQPLAFAGAGTGFRPAAWCNKHRPAPGTGAGTGFVLALASLFGAKPWRRH